MVRGIEKFKDYFAGYEANYVIIGGAACEVHEENYAQKPRATTDMDLQISLHCISVMGVISAISVIGAIGVIGNFL